MEIAKIKTIKIIPLTLLLGTASAWAGEQTVKLSVPGMNCVSCPYMVKKVISQVDGVLCCFTPILAVILGGVGLGSLLGYADHVLLPGLVAFVALTGYALWRRSKQPANA